MKLSDYVIDFIVAERVSHIFEIVGGAITHLLDSTYDRTDIECVSMHHEQAGSFAAEAYARMNGSLGVAMATSGPGALNMVTGIGSCYFDSVPCLFITGQVNTYEYKFDRPQRQIGFQETDIVSVVSPLTKYAEMVVDPKLIRYHLEKAVHLARSGRPGPVLLDLPMNIQRAEVEPESLRGFIGSEEHRALVSAEGREPDKPVYERIIGLMASAERPVILAGGGVRTAGAAEELAALALQTGIPVVSSLMGRDALSGDSPDFYGMIGTYGNRNANLTVANADFLLVVGSRLDTRQTGTRPETFARSARKVQVDADPAELGAKLDIDITVNCDAKVFLRGLNRRLVGQAPGDYGQWRAIIDGYRHKYALEPAGTGADAGAGIDFDAGGGAGGRTDGPRAGGQPDGGIGIDPNAFMCLLARHGGAHDVICLDVGQNQMWAAQSFSLREGQRMLIAGGMGAMGFALPAGIGAVLAQPGSRALVIAGDGGIQINIQELDTVARLGLPLKIFVMNNGCLGMVRQFQDMYFEGRRQSTVKGYGCPDLEAVAAAYRIPTCSIASGDDAGRIVSEVMRAEGPVFVDVKIDLGSMVNPKLVVNKPVEDMSPYLSREELEDNMQIGLAEHDAAGAGQGEPVGRDG